MSWFLCTVLKSGSKTACLQYLTQSWSENWIRQVSWIKFPLKIILFTKVSKCKLKLEGVVLEIHIYTMVPGFVEAICRTRLVYILKLKSIKFELKNSGWIWTRYALTKTNGKWAGLYSFYLNLIRINNI